MDHPPHHHHHRVKANRTIPVLNKGPHTKEDLLLPVLPVLPLHQDFPISLHKMVPHKAKYLLARQVARHGLVASPLNLHLQTLYQVKGPLRFLPEVDQVAPMEDLVDLADFRVSIQLGYITYWGKVLAFGAHKMGRGKKVKSYGAALE